MNLSEVISVNTNYIRSINIERDSKLEQEFNYILTARSLKTLSDISSRFTNTNQQRAWSIIGPYGSGKSAFALFLTDLLSNPSSKNYRQAQKNLQQVEPSLQKKFNWEVKDSNGYLKVLIAGTSEKLSLRYLQGLIIAITDFCKVSNQKPPSVLGDIRQQLTSKKTSTTALLKITEKCQQQLAQLNCPGIVIVFDEFGKFLEYEANSLDSSDVFLLQVLAEQTYSKHNCKLLLLILMHQTVDQYARGVSEQLKNEWAKIQGRFEEVAFLESSEQVLQIVKKVIQQQPQIAGNPQLHKDLPTIVKILQNEGVITHNLAEPSAPLALYKRLYPLHPLTALILPTLCQLISQNERTLFSYLGSNEDSGFKYTINKLNAGDFISPDHIFDYFLTNQITTGGNFLTQRRWVEAVSAVERFHDLTEIEQALLKTIGIINLLGNRNNLKASNAILATIFGKATTQKAIKTLLAKSAIIYRKLNAEYRVWQGSDFDLELAIEKSQNQIDSFSLAEQLSLNQTLAPIVARKYSIENGTLCYFYIKFVDASNYKLAEKISQQQIFIYISSGQDDKKLYTKTAKKYLSNIGITALYQDLGQSLKSLVKQRMALQTIELNSKQLEFDPIAKKEFSSRLTAIEQAENRQVMQLINKPQLSKWIYKNKSEKINSRRDLQQFLSKTLNGIYDKSPILLNELINRNKPSAQAIAARNKLLNAMFYNASKPNLGFNIDKYPPERTMYNSIFKVNGIHRQIASKWTIVKPSKSNSLYPVWQFIEDFFTSNIDQAREFTTINKELLAAPYGIKAGLLPILWLAVYIVNKDKLALFEERNYIPDFNTEKLERFVKRPDLFSIQYFSLSINNNIIKEYGNLFKSTQKANTALDVIKPIARFMGELPEYTLKTKQGLSDNAIAVRNAFHLAKSPQQLLLEKLPMALGYKNLEQEQKITDFIRDLHTALSELNNAYNQLKNDLRYELAKFFEIDTKLDLQDLQKTVQNICLAIIDFSNDNNGMKGLLDRINRAETNANIWFENILLFLGSKPSTSWSDDDKRSAINKLRLLQSDFLDLKKLSLIQQTHNKTNGKDSTFYLLKSQKSGGNKFEKIVSIDYKEIIDIENLTNQLKKAVDGSEKAVQLKALAKFVDDFFISES